MVTGIIFPDCKKRSLLPSQMPWRASTRFRIAYQTSLLTGIVFLMIFSMMPSGVQAGAGSLKVTYHFSKNPAMLEKEVTVALTITNNGTQNLSMYFIGVYLDWLEYNYFYIDTSVTNTSMKYLGIGETYVSNIKFDVPSDAQIGAHLWSICIHYQEGGMGGSNVTWTGSSNTYFTVTKSTSGGWGGIPSDKLVAVFSAVGIGAVMIACLSIAMTSNQNQLSVDSSHNKWRTDLEEDRKGMKVGIALIVAGSITMGMILVESFHFYANTGLFNFLIWFFPMLLIICVMGVVTYYGNLKDTRRISSDGIRLKRRVSTVFVNEGMDGSLKNPSDFMDDPKGMVFVGKLIPKDILALRKLIEGLLTERGAPYRTIEEKPEEWSGVSGNIVTIAPIIKQVYRYILPEDIEIDIGRVNKSGKLTGIMVYVSIFPCTPENGHIVEDWRKPIEDRLKGFVSTGNQ